MAVKAATATVPIVFVIGERSGQDGSGDKSQPARRQRHRHQFRDRANCAESGWNFCDNLSPTLTTIAVMIDPRQSAGVMERDRPRGRSESRRAASHFRHRQHSRSRPDQRCLRNLSERRALLIVSQTRSSLPRVNVPIGGALALPTSCATSRVCRSRRPDELRRRISDAYRQAGLYAGRVLKGEKPADLPVAAIDQVRSRHQPQTAKALGLAVPHDAARPRRRGDRIASARCPLLAQSGHRGLTS